MEQLARHYFAEIKNRKRYDVKPGNEDWETVDMSTFKNKGYDYMCVSRSSLKEYHADTIALPVEIKDKKDQPIELLKVKTCGDNDQYLLVRSHAKALKEKNPLSPLPKFLKMTALKISSLQA